MATRSALFDTGLVPIIDLAPLRNGVPGAKEAVAHKIGDACSNIGFMAITGHGVPQHIIDEMWNVSREYFDFSVEEKSQECRMTKDYPYGYMGLKEEQLSAGLGQIRPADLKESFQIGPHDPRAGAAPRQFPSNPPGFANAWHNYYEAMVVLANDLLELCALALELPQDWFKDKCDKHMSALRSLNYPAGTVAPEKDQFRASEHTDYGSLTILKSGGPGLQVKNKLGEWQNIDPTDDMFVINLGDLMARWTNDRWVSTLHRVVFMEGDFAKRRQSTAFFHNVNNDAEITCIPTCCAEGEAPKYPPISAGEHLMTKHKSTY